ncbi:hypothetical protein L484_001243 [Morus notabilis]|uniref:Uncharacterized protein n=1 Tax=Morus notabilis TaxID=981085 RepID=W9R986_9ROSA|nr:uncharacterized protein LOC21384851 [Morus notabilis]EXB76819.1 hypothetical protein L484_001243 [Morus notabilis]
MHRPSQIPLRKLFSRHPFNQSPKPISPLSLAPDSTRPPITTNSPKPTIPNALISTFRHFVQPNRRNVSTPRRYGGGPGEFDVNKEVDTINLKFAEAREEIEMALESKDSVYFNEEADCARAAVKEVLDMFDGLLGKLPESEKAALQRSMGLKIEQLKAELQQLDD